MPKRWALHPGWVHSQTDRQRQYVGAVALARLYGVPLGECFIILDGRPETERGRDLSPYKHLYPREDGLYQRGGV